MSTATLDRPALVAPAARTNSEDYRNVLEADRQVGAGGYLKALPRKARAWVRSTLDALRVSSVGQALGRGLSRLRGALGVVVKHARQIGLVNMLGALLTCEQGRRLIRKTLVTVARVVTAPVRFLGRLAAKVLNRFGWGRKVVVKVEQSYDRAVTFLATKIEAGLSWLDERETTGAMRWARSYFQGAISSRVIKAYAPANLRTPLYIGSLFLPIVGTTKPTTRAQALVDAVRQSTDDAATLAGIEKATAVISGEAVQVEVVTFSNGDRMAQMPDGQVFEAHDLPGHIALQDDVVAQIAEARSLTEHLAATTGGAPAPTNRAQKRAAAKAFGPRG